MNRARILLLFVLITGECLAATLGAADPAVEECRSRTAVLFREGRSEAATGVASSCVAEARRRGAKDKDLALALHDLGTLHQDAGRLTEADRAYVEAIRLWKGQDGSESHLLSMLRNMAGLRLAQARYTEAERFYREAERTAMGLFAGATPEIADIWNGLAEVYFRSGQLRQAREVGQRALTVFQANGQQARAGVSLFILSKVAWQQGARREAEFLVRAALAAWEISPGKEHENYASGLAGLAVCLSSRNPEEADSLFRQALSILEERLGRTHRLVAFVLLQYGQHLEAHGHKKEGKEVKLRAELILSGGNPRYQQGQTVDVMTLRP